MKQQRDNGYLRRIMRRRTKRRYNNNNGNNNNTPFVIISSSPLSSSIPVLLIVILLLQSLPSLGFASSFSSSVSSSSSSSATRNLDATSTNNKHSSNIHTTTSSPVTTTRTTTLSATTTTTGPDSNNDKQQQQQQEPLPQETTTASAPRVVQQPASRKTKKVIPITVLSGFLGSGKTTLLNNLLNNKEGLKIAVIVNDVASINIDSKLVMNNKKNNDNTAAIQKQKPAAHIIELQNGCACCSLSDELLQSVSELVALNDMKNEKDPSSSFFDHIVIEMSGVSDPRGIRSTFQDAVYYDMPLMERVRLDTMVTLIDCSMFLDYLSSSKTLDPDQLPELFYRDGQRPTLKATRDDGDDDWKKNIPSSLLGALGMCDQYNDMLKDTGVGEVLVSQSEIADIVLLNKVDLVREDDDSSAVLLPAEKEEEEGDGSSTSSSEKLDQIEDIIRAINPRATVVRTECANVPYTQILGVTGSGNNNENGIGGVAEAGIIEDHREAVFFATSKARKEQQQQSATKQDDAVFFSTSNNSNNNNNNNGVFFSTSRRDNDHSQQQHDHQPQQHAHDNNNQNKHGHHHNGGGKKHMKHTAGIGTYVYQARRPFHPGRFRSSFLRFLPGQQQRQQEATTTTTSLSSSATEEEQGQQQNNDNDPGEDDDENETATATRAVLRCVLRSKGFVWFANSNTAAFYWSHAGSSTFEMSVIGQWWATLPRSEWPPEAVSTILHDFDDVNHAEVVSLGSTTTVGDRRQEIVFIGPRMGRRDTQDNIRECLDRCLLNDEEWDLYRKHKWNDEHLDRCFFNDIETKILDY